jgi:hypothetical protein
MKTLFEAQTVEEVKARIGPLTPVEWAALTYRHLDHHLRRFQV